MLRPKHIYTFFIVFPVGLKARYGPLRIKPSKAFTMKFNS
jgi:hypothetical protein